MDAARIRGTMCSHRQAIGTVVFLVVAAGCALTLDDRYVRESFVRGRWLQFLQDGRTSQQEVTASLGEPSAYLQDGKILAYRLILVEEDREVTEEEYQQDKGSKSAVNKRRQALSENGRLLVVRGTMEDERFWLLRSRAAEYSLVLMFDESHILRTHSFLRVAP
jgi:hypothetical protein